MNPPALACEDERRRELVRRSERAGIDYVEVDERDQRTLHVHLFGHTPKQLGKQNVRIDGGRRIRDLEITSAALGRQGSDDVLQVRVSRAGDFSTYTLHIVEGEDGRPSQRPLASFDRRYAQADFSFKVGCPSDLDCKSDAPCPPPVRSQPEISYLAKDYASFRQLILDRLAVLLPDWRERHVPDIGIMLVELLAYVGDSLSYHQDAVATEAYLDTARQRISVRRHARLVDYVLHEGCNARAWLTLWTEDDTPLDPADVFFATSDEVAPTLFEPALPDGAPCLELYQAHNTIDFYTWGDAECCLPRGATAATLADGWLFAAQPAPAESRPEEQKGGGTGQAIAAHAAHQPSTAKPQRKLHLRRGDVLVFEEVLGPRTGRSEDADPTHRHAVRLTSVRPVEDPLVRQAEPGADRTWPTPALEIEWARADALPFALCLSARLDAPDCSVVDRVSVARGNVVLVDHGYTIDGEPLGQVGIATTVGRCACAGAAIDVAQQPEVFGSALKQAPLTHRAALPSAKSPAASALTQDPRAALPQVALVGLPGICPDPDDGGEPRPRDGIVADDPAWRWQPRPDLLDSGGQDQDFVVETDDDGRAHLRFGDGQSGRQPDACTIFAARYRVGNGTAGNVGAETITSARFRKRAVGPTITPRNPLPARGGTAPEPLAEAKLFAPQAFRREIQRAITADDYARLAERAAAGRIQRAGASLRWTGSWYAAQVAIDPTGRETASRRDTDAIERVLYRYRRIGHDLDVRPARYVPLDIELHVCVLPHYLRGHVRAALSQILGNGTLADGGRGFFHPDKLTFGDAIRASALVAAAQAVPGVESVVITKLQRFGEGDNGERANGILTIGPLEIAQLDGDPSFPEHGTLKLTLEGGR